LSNFWPKSEMENLFKNLKYKNFMKIRPVGIALFHTHKHDEASSRLSIPTTTTTTTTLLLLLLLLLLPLLLLLLLLLHFYKMYGPFFHVDRQRKKCTVPHRVKLKGMEIMSTYVLWSFVFVVTILTVYTIGHYKFKGADIRSLCCMLQHLEDTYHNLGYQVGSKYHQCYFYGFRYSRR
jgi:hypothetical protein